MERQLRSCVYKIIYIHRSRPNQGKNLRYEPQVNHSTNLAGAVGATGSATPVWDLSLMLDVHNSLVWSDSEPENFPKSLHLQRLKVAHLSNQVSTANFSSAHGLHPSLPHYYRGRHAERQKTCNMMLYAQSASTVISGWNVSSCHDEHIAVILITCHSWERMNTWEFLFHL